MHVCVCEYGKYHNTKIHYMRMLVRLRMRFKYIEIVCRKTHDVSANAYIWISSLIRSSSKTVRKTLLCRHHTKVALQTHVSTMGSPMWGK